MADPKGLAKCSFLAQMGYSNLISSSKLRSFETQGFGSYKVVVTAAAKLKGDFCLKAKGDF